MTRWLSPQGYIRLVGKQYHPRGWISEHRWVVQQILGRELLPSEAVHHRNGNKADNRPENLVVVRPGPHVAHHNHERSPNVAAGRWAEHFDECVECGQKDKFHAAQGRCFRCYDRDYQRERRHAQGAIPQTVRDTAWSVDRDGKIYEACRDCGRSSTRPGARGRCQACVRYRRLHGGHKRPA